MNNSSLQQPIVEISGFVEQMAALINLPILPADRAGVIANFERIVRVAQLVNEFPLSETVEVAPYFEP